MSFGSSGVDDGMTASAAADREHMRAATTPKVRVTLSTLKARMASSVTSAKSIQGLKKRTKGKRVFVGDDNSSWVPCEPGVAGA